MDWDSWNYLMAMAATVAFAVTAVLAIMEKEVDLFGAVVLGLVTAVGGGTIRDLVLDVPVFWADDLSYIWVGAAASVAAFYGRKIFAQRKVFGLMLYLDGFGAALFAVQATGKVWDQGFGLPAAPVILGVITAIGGGLIRDVLAGRATLLMRPELYAVPMTLGSILFVVSLEYFPEHRLVASILCLAFTFGLRAAAIRWDLQVPRFARSGGESL